MYNVQAKCNANLYRGVSRRELRGVFVNIDNIYIIQQLSNLINHEKENNILVPQKVNIVRQLTYWYAK